MDVSRCISVLDTSISVTSNLGRREYLILIFVLFYVVLEANFSQKPISDWMSSVTQSVHDILLQS